MFIKLNLPKPSEELVSEIYRIAETSPLELELKKKHDLVQNYTVNSVSRKFIENDKNFNELVQKEFSSYFTEPFYPAVGIVTNTDITRTACWPPHSDRVRIFALNYYLEEGGSNVETVIYKSFDNYNAGVGTGKIYNYSDLETDKKYHLVMNQWYGLNVRQVHSIENVETRRIIFTISFHDLTFFDFEKKYVNLIIGEESYR
jgi:hypothetical protein